MNPVNFPGDLHLVAKSLRDFSPHRKWHISGIGQLPPPSSFPRFLYLISRTLYFLGFLPASLAVPSQAPSLFPLFFLCSERWQGSGLFFSLSRLSCGDRIQSHSFKYSMGAKDSQLHASSSLDLSPEFQTCPDYIKNDSIVKFPTCRTTSIYGSHTSDCPPLQSKNRVRKKKSHKAL